MHIVPKTYRRLGAAILVLALFLMLPTTIAAAAKVVRFVPTDVYYDGFDQLTLVGQFHNTGDEYITGVQDFVPVVYLDDEMYAAQTFSFRVDLQPGYYAEKVMKFDVTPRNFSNWYVRWDAFAVY